jgi:hypothetical protein
LPYILRVPAGSAARKLGNVRRLHRDVERISPYYLMHMWRGSLAWIDKRVDTVDDILSASKTQHGEALGAAELRRCLRDGSEEQSGKQHDEQ